jgi:colicin import membrane protein
MDFESLNPVIVYSEFQAQLAELRELNDSLVFNYEDPAHNKEARSHVRKLRSVKSAIEDRRKTAKADALEYGRKLDGLANEYKGQIDAMIEVHMKPITEIDERETRRKETVEMAFKRFDFAGTIANRQGITEQLQWAESLQIEQDVFLDRTDFAQFRKSELITNLKVKLGELERIEQERAELEKLRAEKAERDAKEAEERIVREREEERAREEKEREARRVEDERRAEDAKRIQDAQDALAREREQLEADKRAADKAKAEAELRELDMEHKKSVNRKILASFVSMGVDESVAQKIITAIVKKEIHNLEVRY